MSAAKKYLVKNGLKGLSSTQKVDKGRNHVAMIKDNSNYPELQDGLDDLTSACDELEQSVLEVQFSGGKLAWDRKVVREAQVDELIIYMAERVQVLSFGSKSKILSAGYDVRRASTPIYSMGVPPNLRAEHNAKAGTIELRWKAVHGAKFYQVMMTSGDPNSTEGWEMAGVSGRTTHTVDNLETGKFYNFRVKAVGARAESGLSDLARSIAA